MHLFTCIKYEKKLERVIFSYVTFGLLLHLTSEIM